MSSEGLRVRGAAVQLGTTTAVDGVDLDVAPGEVLAILGPSGCGKSSLLRAVAGLEPLSAGSVHWDGTNMHGVPVHRREFGLMFQEGQLFPHRDVAGNVEFGLRMGRMPPAQRKVRVAELLELVGLTGFGGRAVASISGGQQQRVALARALAPRPHLLLLDEPLSALDRELRESLSGELRRILTRAGTTALYVTHDHDEAFAVADQVAVMRAGQIVQLGTPQQVWQQPAGPEIAQFLGYRVVEHDGAILALGPDALLAAAESSPTVGSQRAQRQNATTRTGAAVATGFARGRATVRVQVDGWGELTALLADASLEVVAGDAVTVAIDWSRTVRMSSSAKMGSLTEKNRPSDETENLESVSE